MKVIWDCPAFALAAIFDHTLTDQAPNVAVHGRTVLHTDGLAEIEPCHTWVAYDGVEHERIAQGQALLVDLAQPDQKANGRARRFDHRFIFQSLTRDLCHGLVIAENHGCNNEGADEEYQASFPAVAFAWRA